MNISGFIKNSLLDYPGKIASVIFTQGCNFRCPYCHNKQLWNCSDGSIPQTEVMQYIEDNAGLLDGVVVTGGEPTVQPELIPFLEQLKWLNLSVKIDTNGSRPEILAELLQKKLIDYVAMDIKSELLPLPYSRAAGITFDKTLIDALHISIHLIIESGVAHEFRTTMCREYVSLNHLYSIAPVIKDCRVYYLQQCHCTSLEQSKTGEYSLEELREFTTIITHPFLHVRE